MHLFSAVQVKEFLASGQLDGAVHGLAVAAARSVLPLRGDGISWRLVHSAAVSLAEPAEGPIEARATLVSEPAANPATCQVELLQAGLGDEARLAQLTFGFVSAASQSEDASPARKASQAAPLSETAEARRRQIFDGACRVIAKHGFGNASMREIAKEAGISVPLMYKYIKDKDDILYLITTLSMQDIIDFFDTEEFAQGPAEANLAKAIDRYVDYIGINRRYINLVYSETRSLSAENRSRVFDMERAFMKRWQAILDRGVVRGEFQQMDTALMSNYIYFLCTIWSLRYWSVSAFGEEAVRDSLKEFILKGVRNPAT